jgi:hypothetical protein
MHCPKHDTELIEPAEKEWKGKLLLCPVKGCNTHQLLAPRQKKLPGLDPGVQSKVIRVSEAALIQQAVQWGGLKGYEVLQIGQNVQYPKCPGCRKAAKRILCPHCLETYAPELYSTSTTGTPDTFWGKREWGNVWKGIEWKAAATAPVRQAQQRLVALGVSEVAWSLETLQLILG